MNAVPEMCSSQCGQCLFSKNKIVSDERKKEILRDLKKDNTYFECHKGTIEGKKIICFGYAKTMPNTFTQIGLRLQLFKYVNPNKL